MKNQLNGPKSGEIVIYQSSKGKAEIEVYLKKESIWLDAHKIAQLFGTQRPAIVKHVNNIYKTGELSKDSTCSISEQVAADGKIRKMNLYNLDVIISVGYRVNSMKATHFRIWATKTLKEHLINGYTINQKRLLNTKGKFEELKTAISFLQEKSEAKLLFGQSQEILFLISSYAKTLTLLEEYDTGKMREKKGERAKFILTYENCLNIINELKNELAAKNEAGDLFGHERNRSFEGIINGLYQTFGGKELYLSIEDKAAHLLYFIIKDHPFSDGNKRSAAFLFVYYLKKADYLYRKNGERKINDNALTVLAILMAESDPKEKGLLNRICG